MTHKARNNLSNGTLRFVSWNVKGLGNPVKRAKVLAHLKSLQPDIILLQETHAKCNVQSVLRANWLCQAYHALRPGEWQYSLRETLPLFRKQQKWILMADI